MLGTLRPEITQTLSSSFPQRCLRAELIEHDNSAARRAAGTGPMVNIAQPHPHNKEYADGKTLTHPLPSR